MVGAKNLPDSEHTFLEDNVCVSDANHQEYFFLPHFIL